MAKIRPSNSAYDGNGNVRALVKADAANPAASAVVERYAYDGVGREISAPPLASRLSSFAFSTKDLEIETGMNYYGYRFYDSNNGRWINRDPVEEEGGMNVYAMVGNGVTNFIDYRGLIQYVPSKPYGNPLSPYDNGNHNCYSYACQDPKNPFRNPGEGKEPYKPTEQLDCANMTRRAKLDQAKDVAADGKCPCGTHMVFLTATGGTVQDAIDKKPVDYHWYLQNPDGTWSQKHGRGGPIEPVLDKNGNPVTDPAQAEHEFGPYKYKPCGKLRLKNRTY